VVSGRSGALFAWFSSSWVRSPVERRSLLSVEEKESADEREERKKMPVGWGK